MKPMYQRDPFRVGLVAIVAGGLLGVAVLVFSVASFGTTSYTVELEHTAGLRAGESVEVHGVVKGKVTGIELADDRVIATFDLENDVELGADTVAEVKVATLLGTHFLDIDPAGGGELSDGRIPLAQSSVPFNLQDIIEEGVPQLEELDAETLAKSLTVAADTIGVTSDELGPTLEGVARLSQVISKRSAQTGQLLRSARSVTDQLSDSSDDIVELMRQTNLVISEVTARREAISRLLTETTALSDALTAVAQATTDDLGPALRNVNLALDTLNKQDKRLQNLLEMMAPAARYVANASGGGPYGALYAKDPAFPGDDVTCQLRGTCVR